MAAIGNYGNYPGIASDAGGRAMMAWFSSAEANRGVLAQGVNADGTPAGAVMTMPGSAVMVGGGTVSRTPIVARAKNGGFYVAYALGYPTANQVRVWRVGGLERDAAGPHRGELPDRARRRPKGRIWAVWSDGTFGETHVLAARSNPEATEFGAPVDAGAVKGAHSTYSVDASATASALDILALFGTGNESGGATYHARVQPGLTLKARKSGGRVTFTVTDAGDPVQRRAREGRRPLRPHELQGPRRSWRCARAPRRRPRPATSPRSCACDELLRAARRRGVLAPVEQLKTLNTDIAKQLGAQTLGARLWRLRPGEWSTRHRHYETHELYLVLEGEGRMRIGTDSLTLPRLSAVLVEPDEVRQIFNDTDADALWYVVGAPSEPANTLEMSEETLAFMYPDGPKVPPPELAP